MRYLEMLARHAPREHWYSVSPGHRGWTEVPDGSGLSTPGEPTFRPVGSPHEARRGDPCSYCGAPLAWGDLALHPLGGVPQPDDFTVGF